MILFLFNDSKSDIKCQKKDSFADYSDLSVLDAKSLKVYNDRGWARELLTAEDRVLLNQRIGEVFHKNSRYVRTTLADGTVVLDINNKILLLGGTLERPIICNVLVINAVSESDAELFKEDIYAYTEGKYITEEAYKERCRITQDCYGAQIIRHFDSSDYKYQKGQYDSGNRATLPDNWQNYGYTERKQDRRRVSPETHEYDNESIKGVVTVSTVSETYAEYIKGVVYDGIQHNTYDRRTLAYFLETIQRVSEEDDIRFYDADDYFYSGKKHDIRKRATLPDNWQNYGYTEGKQDRRRVSPETQGRISGSGDLIESEYKKKGCSHNDSEINLWEPMDPQEDGKGEDILRETPD
ncbi:MAG: hypothetical protein IJV88_00885 [Ruminococcus sp.]|nr:hypothetical protein [Ruminococcus sp.]